MKKKRCKTPTIIQMEATECGAVALAIILAYYGRYISLEELRIACGVSRNGSNALGITQAAKQHGLSSQAYSLGSLKEFFDPQIQFPVILHWAFNHFVVLEGIQNQKYYINDPASGPRAVLDDEFEKKFTGVVINLKPKNDFCPKGKPTSIWTTLVKKVRGSKAQLWFVILATLSLVIPGIAIPAFSKIFIDNILVNAQNNWFLPLIWAILFVACLQGIFIWLQEAALLRLQIKFMFKDTTDYVWHILRLPIQFFTQRYLGDIIDRVQANVRIADLLSSGLSQNFVNLIKIIFFALVMLVLNWQLACISFLIIGINITIFFIISRKIADYSRNFLQKQGLLRGIEINGLQNIDVLKINDAEDAFFSRWSHQHTLVNNQQVSMMKLNQTLSILSSFLLSLSGIIILIYGGWQIIQGIITIGTLVAFTSLVGMFFAPINQLIGLGQNIQQIRGDLSRLKDVLMYPLDLRHLKTKTYKPLGKLRGEITMSGVSFGYAPLDAPVLSNIHLQLRSKETIAIIGETGSGKSTLARLLLGLYQPRTGKICYDNVCLVDVEPSLLARKVALVDQDFYLFEGSVLENLTLWDYTIDPKKIDQALKDACAYDFLATRGGASALLEEGGRNFSGGERQRLEIARALLKSPAILILDEATSALDPFIEGQVFDNIKKYTLTTIIITHQLNLLKRCDHIIAISEGKIIQSGTYEELQKHPGYLYDLINKRYKNEH